ncbi:MAG TPA: enoyl-CoA hydratase/isomerase family protein [Solirubrobacteraceae bacterium]
MAEFSTLTLESDAPIARLTLNRPDRLNALSREALAELIAAAEKLGQAAEVKVVIVAGAGRAFSAGFDLGGFGGEPTTGQVDLGRRMADAVTAIPAITVAAIHGHCVGGAVVLAAACDIRVAAARTRFAIPEIDLGIPLAWGGIPRLVRELGPALTKELVLTCRPFTAEEAQASRFLNRVVADDELRKEVDALASALASKSRLLLTQTKQLIDAAMEDAYSTGQSFRDADAMMTALRDEESRAASRRYLEGRAVGGR